MAHPKRTLALRDHADFAPLLPEGRHHRRAKVAALDDYLRELDAALGPIPAGEQRAAREWADHALGPRPDRAHDAA